MIYIRLKHKDYKKNDKMKQLIKIKYLSLQQCGSVSITDDNPQYTLYSFTVYIYTPTLFTIYHTEMYIIVTSKVYADRVSHSCTMI